MQDSMQIIHPKAQGGITEPDCSLNKSLLSEWKEKYQRGLCRVVCVCLSMCVCARECYLSFHHLKAY